MFSYHPVKPQKKLPNTNLWCKIKVDIIIFFLSVSLVRAITYSFLLDTDGDFFCIIWNKYQVIHLYFRSEYLHFFCHWRSKFLLESSKKRAKTEWGSIRIITIGFLYIENGSFSFWKNSVITKSVCWEISEWHKFAKWIYSVCVEFFTRTARTGRSSVSSTIKFSMVTWV